MKVLLFIFFIIVQIIKSKRKVINVTYIDQTKDYPTGCESVSTVMCLNYHGFDMSVDEFIQNYLEMGEMYYKGNKLYAPDPNVKFIGSPYDPHSYGCYEPVIEKALNKVIKDKNKNEYQVKDLTNVPMDDIILNYIDKDIPVIFWSTIDLKPYFNGTKWFIPETGKEYIWRAREHCLLLVGYDTDNNTYVFNDPWNNHGVIDYDKDTVEKRHQEQYSMAVVLFKNN